MIRHSLLRAVTACALSLLILPAVAAPSGAQRRWLNFGYGLEKVRGVNLGGWLVLEP